MTELSTNTLDAFYKEVCKDNTKKLGTDLASRDSQVNMYKDPTHFIYEILQNADDHKATKIDFNLKKKHLTITHNGQRFAKKNVEAITYFGKSTSASDTTKVGRFGLGFKSVFAFTDTPIIQSGSFSFIIHGLYSPERHDELYDKTQTTITLPFNKENLTPKQAFDKIAEKLNQLSADTLLFTKHLAKLNWAVDGEVGEIVKITEDSKNVKIITIEHKSKSARYLIFGKKFVSDGKEYRNINIAFCLNEQGKITKADDDKLFVLFKTNEPTQVRFLINAIFQTTPNRESIDFTSDFNVKMIGGVSELFIEAMQSLQKQKLLTAEILELLPLNEPDNEISQALVSTLIDALHDKQLKLPTTSKSYGFCDEVSINDEKLDELLKQQQLKMLFGKKYWLSDSYLLNSFLKKELKVLAVDGNFFLDKLNKQFLKKMSDDWLKQFYGWCVDQQYYLDCEQLKTQEIIRIQNSNRQYTAAFDGDNKHQVFLLTEGSSNFRYVHKNLLKGKYSTKSKKFLKETLGIDVVNTVDEVHAIVKAYSSSQSETGQNYKQNFLTVFNLWHNAQDNKQAIIKECSNKYFILTAKHEYKQAESVHFDSEELQRWFKGNGKKVRFLHPSLKKPRYKDFLLNLGVNQYPKQICNKGINAGNSEARRRSRSSHDFNPDFNFTGLQHCLKNNIDQKLSVYLFSLACKYIDKLYGKIEYRRRLQDAFEAEEKFSNAGELLTKHIWLYNKNKEKQAINEIRLSDLHDAYELPDERAKIEKALQFKPEFYTEQQVQEKVEEKDKIINDLKLENQNQRLEIEELHNTLQKHRTIPETTINIDDLQSPTERALSDIPRAQPGRRGNTSYPPHNHEPEETNKNDGRQGEALAFKYLLGLQKDNEKVIWLNQNNEQNESWDIVLVNNDGDILKYYEVKSKAEHRPTMFQVSKKQWDTATEKKEKYVILLVGGVNSENEPADILPIENPVMKSEQGVLGIQPSQYTIKIA